MRILVIEDEMRLANFIKRCLREQRYEVHTASDGEEGLRLALGESFEFIVLDWGLPKKDGVSMLKELRERENMTPVLMLTARDSIEDIIEALDSGSDDYLTKPFAIAELMARVRAILRRNKLGRGAEIRFSNLRLDPISHKVWRNDKEIGLTAKEYGLLEYFMRNPRQVVTRAMIAEHVWRCGLETISNIVDVYVKYLRKKIDHTTKNKLIHTVRGKGYILNSFGR